MGLFFSNTGLFLPLIIISTFYFILLVFGAVFKHYITSRGLFYVLVCALLGLFIALLRLFDPILVWGQMAAWEGILTPASGLMPEIGLSFAVDSLSFCFLLLVVTIGLGTNIYALNYFKYEANEDSFILLLN